MARGCGQLAPELVKGSWCDASGADCRRIQQGIHDEGFLEVLGWVRINFILMLLPRAVIEKPGRQQSPVRVVNVVLPPESERGPWAQTHRPVPNNLSDVVEKVAAHRSTVDGSQH